MYYTNMIVFQGGFDAQGRVTNRYSTGQFKPEETQIQPFTWNSTRTDDGDYLFQVMRNLTSDDLEFFDIPLSTKFPMIWSENTKTYELIKHTNHGNFEMYVTNSSEHHSPTF